MKPVRPLVTICIPTYNGAATLAETLDGIVAQAFDGLEVIVCDDASADDTPALAARYAERFAFVRLFRNDRNLGMDRNFARSVQHATGTYVWFSGQDDIFRPGAIAKFRAIVADHPDVDVVYFNYRRMSGDLSREVDPPRLDLRDDVFVASASEYFRAVDHAPTFLAATVMRRAFWDTTPYERFLDTHYVQMGVVLHNLREARVYVVADPRYVDCRIPEDSWKLQGAQMLFETYSGTFEVYHTILHSDHNPVPSDLFRQMQRQFIRRLPTHAVILRARGFRVTPVIARRMRKLFGERPLLYWSYVWPLLHMPIWLAAAAHGLHRSALTAWIPSRLRRLISWLGSRGLA